MTEMPRVLAENGVFQLQDVNLVKVDGALNEPREFANGKFSQAAGVSPTRHRLRNAGEP